MTLTTVSFQARFWREPKRLELLDNKARQSLSTRVLELHFTRLFAIKLLCKFCDAAREATAQAALESLLRDEEKIKKDKEAKESKKKKKANKSKKPAQSSGNSDPKNESESLDAVVISTDAKDSVEQEETTSSDKGNKKGSKENNETKGEKVHDDHASANNASRKGEKSRKENLDRKDGGGSLSSEASLASVDGKNKNRSAREEKIDESREKSTEKAKSNKKEGNDFDRTFDIVNKSPFAVLNEVGSEDEVKLNRISEAEKTADTVKADLKASKNKSAKERKRNSSSVQSVQSSNGNSASNIRAKSSSQNTPSAGRNGISTQKGGSSSHKLPPKSPEKATKSSLKAQAQQRKTPSSVDGVASNVGEGSSSHNLQGPRVHQSATVAAASAESRTYVTHEDQGQDNPNVLRPFNQRSNGVNPLYSHVSGGTNANVWSGSLNVYNSKTMWTQKPASFDSFQNPASLGAEYNNRFQDPLSTSQAISGSPNGSRDSFLADPVVSTASEKNTFYPWHNSQKPMDAGEPKSNHLFPPGFPHPSNELVNGRSRQLSYAELTSRNLSPPSDGTVKGDDMSQHPMFPIHFQDGIVFTCTKFTKDECYQRNLFGLPKKDLAVSEILYIELANIF